MPTMVVHIAPPLGKGLLSPDGNFTPCQQSDRSTARQHVT